MGYCTSSSTTWTLERAQEDAVDPVTQLVTPGFKVTVETRFRVAQDTDSRTTITQSTMMYKVRKKEKQKGQGP